MSNKKTIALAVAGGGYRATLYSLGSLWRINEFGLLKKLLKITSVSGGSILTGYLAVRWCDLKFDNLGRATNFFDIIAKDILKFCSKNIGYKTLIAGLLSFTQTIGDKLARVYDRELFNGARIQSLSNDGPQFLFYGTNYQTGSSLGIQKKELYDYKIGHYPKPDITMAETVVISGAFPPFFAPVILRTDPRKWVKINKRGFSEYFNDKKYRTKLILADGGLYDNLGLEAVWKGGYTHVLSCDAGAPFKVTPMVRTNWASQVLRMQNLMIDQQRALRKRILIDRYIKKTLGGTYYGISTKINEYEFKDSMTRDTPTSSGLQNLATQLEAFTKKEQGHLVNWGYALTDTAIRKFSPEILDSALNKRGTWVIPEYPL